MRKLIAICLLVLFSCSDDADPRKASFTGSSCQEDVGQIDPCPDQLVCQLSYLTIHVEIIDTEGNPVIFQETTLRNLDTGQFLEVDPEFPPEKGYIIAEDSMVDILDREGDCVQLSGFIAGNLVFQYSFLVGHDCCHVELLAGPSTITI